MTSTHFVLLATLCAATGAWGQGAPAGRCQFRFDNTPETRTIIVQLPSKQYNTFIGGGVVARCPSQKIVLRSDSLEVYGDEGRFFFIGHVDYKEPRLGLKADYLTYFQREERILAFLNVDATLPTGSKLKGASLEYFRAVPRVRAQQQGIAVGRPTISIIEKDAQGKAQPPVNVTGNTIWLQGDSIVSSQGEVVVVRPELTATGDSLYLNGGTGLLRIMRKPRIVGTKGRPFTLVGETIDLLSRRRKLERVLAKGAGEAVSEDLNLRSDSIDLRVTDDLLQRAIAWGGGRATATSRSQKIVSDSIDVLMPGQKIRQMHAVRGASAEGSPDTTRFRTTEKDRLTGDTIIARFDSVTSRDTAATPNIRELVAIGRATSLQHLAARDTACHLPAINYVRGRVITVTFDSAKVKKVEVNEKDGESAGLYNEPNPDCGKPAAGAVPAGAAPASGRGSPPPATRPAAPPAAPPATAGTPVKKP